MKAHTVERRNAGNPHIVIYVAMTQGMAMHSLSEYPGDSRKSIKRSDWIVVPETTNKDGTESSDILVKTNKAKSSQKDVPVKNWTMCGTTVSPL